MRIEGYATITHTAGLEPLKPANSVFRRDSTETCSIQFEIHLLRVQMSTCLIHTAVVGRGG